jgi:hypothetical protein
MSQEFDFNRENDEAELEQLYRKKYGGLLKLTEEDIATIQKLELRKFGNTGYAVLTPVRQQDRLTMSSSSASSTSSSISSGGSLLTKASTGFAKVLGENRMFKNKFAETRILDVEEEIFAMNKEFHSAAEYHAPFLLFMKYDL